MRFKTNSKKHSTFAINIGIIWILNVEQKGLVLPEACVGGRSLQAAALV